MSMRTEPADPQRLQDITRRVGEAEGRLAALEQAVARDKACLPGVASALADVKRQTEYVDAIEKNLPVHLPGRRQVATCPAASSTNDTTKPFTKLKRCVCFISMGLSQLHELRVSFLLHIADCSAPLHARIAFIVLPQIQIRVTKLSRRTRSRRLKRSGRQVSLYPRLLLSLQRSSEVSQHT